jgi:dolichol-phosphate mannosyltransferase
MLSIVIPAHNEEDCLESTVLNLYHHLKSAHVPHEILVINDNSTDQTERILQALSQDVETFCYVNNAPPHGFGFAVRRGLEVYRGDAVAIYMADASDKPEDLIRFWNTLNEEKVDCVFGTRFHRQSRVIDYPWPKRILNRLANKFIQLIFGLAYNDVTNAFKLYRRNVIEGAKPFLSHHFNLTVELPLKAIVRGYTYTVVPNDWINRKTGISKLKIKEMGSRYLFIVLYCLVEKWLSQGDYAKREITFFEPISDSTPT